MTLDSFLNCIKKSTEEFNKISSNEHIRVISNYDCDGLTSAALITKALAKQDRIFSVRIIKQLTNKILKEIATERYNLEVKNGLRMFGSQTRPLHKMLQFSTDPYIPGVTGDEQAAISLLEESGIEYYANNKWKKLNDLTEEEVKRLTTVLIMKISNYGNPKNIFGPVYSLKNEANDSILKDVKEFSTVLNCCGRLNKPGVGIGLCLNDKQSKGKALELISEYRKEITEGLEWFYNNKNQEGIIEHENYVLIIAEGYIRDSLIGTITSIISKSGIYNEGKILISMAHNVDGNTKISARISRYNANNINVKEILDSICTGINAEVGGHIEAAGAIISQADEELFIRNVKEFFNKSLIENVGN